MVALRPRAGLPCRPRARAARAPARTMPTPATASRSPRRCRGRRSTTTTRAISISSKSASRQGRAAARADRHRRRRRAGAEGLAARPRTPPSTRRRSTRRRSSSRCCRRSSRPTCTSLNQDRGSRGDGRRHDDRRRRRDRRVGHLPRAGPQQGAAHLQRRRGLARGTGAGARGAVAASRDSTRRSGCRTRSPARLRDRRADEGALEFARSELRPVVDGDGVTELRTETTNRAKSIIENFMVAANGVTARFLTERGFATIRRVVKSPERWARIVDLASQHGGSLPGAPDARALQQFLKARRDAEPDTFQDLSLAIIKLLGRGEYVAESAAEPSGHFALATGHLLALDGAEPALPRCRHPAAAEGGDREASGPVSTARTAAAGRPLHEAGGRGEQGRAADGEGGGGAVADAADRRRRSMRSSPAPDRRARGSGSCRRRSKDGSSAAPKGSTSATACASGS